MLRRGVGLKVVALISRGTGLQHQPALSLYLPRKQSPLKTRLTTTPHSSLLCNFFCLGTPQRWIQENGIGGHNDCLSHDHTVSAILEDPNQHQNASLSHAPSLESQQYLDHFTTKELYSVHLINRNSIMLIWQIAESVH